MHMWASMLSASMLLSSRSDIAAHCLRRSVCQVGPHDSLGAAYLETQIVCFVHKQLNFFAPLKHSFNVVYHDVLHLIILSSMHSIANTDYGLQSQALRLPVVLRNMPDR